MNFLLHIKSYTLAYTVNVHELAFEVISDNINKIWYIFKFSLLELFQDCQAGQSIWQVLSNILLPPLQESAEAKLLVRNIALFDLFDYIVLFVVVVDVI